MLNGIFGILIALLALLSAGFFSYPYFVDVQKSNNSTVEVASVVTPTTSVPIKVPIRKATVVSASVPVKVTTPLVSVSTSTVNTVATPGPLRVPVSSASAADTTLTVRGVIEYTNLARMQNGGLVALTENEILNRDAELKLNDMFSKQYFEHVSPTGVGPADLAKVVGYAYVLVGENLALGDFGSDTKLVDAWMNSPGHRANILNVHYQEIGVAVGKGMYEGRETWIAVQSFGMPLSACPAIDQIAKAQITANNIVISNLKIALDAKKTQLDSTPTNDPNYNTYVGEFNALVAPYNTKVQENKALVETFNAGIRLYNDCLAAASVH